MFDTASRLAIAGVLGLTMGATPTLAQDAPQHERPNILLIIADDVGIDMTPGMYPGLIDRLTRQYGPDGLNHPDYRLIDGHPASTPNLDTFASEGMVFTDAWAQPFCSPTRASMLTGLYAAKTGVITYADALSQHHDSFVRTLHDSGYATAAIGKWHMAGLVGRNGAPDYPGMKPREAGFDFYRGDMNAALPTFWDYPVQVQDEATAPSEWRNEQPEARSLPGIASTKFAGVTKTADLIDWIEQQESADPDQPWFAWFAFNLAHATARREPSQMVIPDKDTLDAATIAEIDACGGHYGTQDPGDCSGEAQMRAMTNAMDTMIGRILDVVDQIPNTYVIIVGDNGTPVYPKNLGPDLSFIDNMYITREGRGKGTTFESGARVEFAIRGPGIAHGFVSDETVHVVDVYNTVLDLAGLPTARTVSNRTGDGTFASDSVSLKPILTGQATAVRDPVSDVIITEDSDLMRGSINVVGARNREWKVVCATSADNCILYNLVADPLEEYPLENPASCPADATVPAAEDRIGNYCYLTHAVATNSIFAKD